MLSDKWDISISPSFSKLRDHHRRGARKTIRSRGWEDADEIVSPGHDKTESLMNSQQLVLHIQNLHKMKPLNIPVWSRRDSQTSTTD